MAAFTPAMTLALHELRLRTGEGCIDRYGRIVAAGEALPFDGATWLRLMTLGMVEPAGPLRIKLTAAGAAHDLN